MAFSHHDAEPHHSNTISLVSSFSWTETPTRDRSLLKNYNFMQIPSFLSFFPLMPRLSLSTSTLIFPLKELSVCKHSINFHFHNAENSLTPHYHHIQGRSQPYIAVRPSRFFWSSLTWFLRFRDRRSRNFSSFIVWDISTGRSSSNTP